MNAATVAPNFRQPRRRSEEHLAYLRKLPCCDCGRDRCGEASHTNFSDARYPRRARRNDHDAVPLCGLCHRDKPNALHNVGEAAFWEILGLDPYALAARLWEVTGDVEAGRKAVRQFRQGTP